MTATAENILNRTNKNRLKPLLALLLLSYPLNIFSILDIGSYSVTFLHVFILLFSTFILISKINIYLSYYYAVLGFLWFLCGIVGTILNFNLIDTSTITALIQIFFIIIVFISGCVFVQREKDLFPIIVFIGTLFACYSIFQFYSMYSGNGIHVFRVTNLQLQTIDGLQRGISENVLIERLRIPSTFVEPSDAGRFFSICFIFSFMFPSTKYSLICRIILLLGVLLSVSFGAILILIFAYCLSVSVLITFIFILGAIILSSNIVWQEVWFLPLYFSEKLDAIFSGRIFVNSGRFNDFYKFPEVFNNNPLFGNGIGSADQVYECCIVANFPVNFIGEYGLLGLLFIVVFFLILLTELKNKYHIWLLLFILLGFLWKPQLYDFLGWFVIGIICGMASLQRQTFFKCEQLSDVKKAVIL